MSTYVLIMIAAIVILLALSACFSGSETALTAVSRGRMHQLEIDGSGRAREVNRLVADREGLIGSVLLGNTFINILISALATSLFTEMFGQRGVAITAFVMTAVILVFAEVLPKTLAIARTDRFALTVAWPLRLFVTVLAPIVRAVQFIVWQFLRLFGVSQTEAVPLLPAHEEIRGTVALHHAEGGVEREHRDMIGGILDLRELGVGDVMVHRKNLAAVDSSLPSNELFDAIMAAGHTRVPVWKDTPENIIGVIHTKDIAREFVKRRGDVAGFDVLTLMTEPWFVPDTTSLEEQLRAFREHRTHFALVVDEYGSLQGVVTLEDILDEIFGGIPDEHDVMTQTGIRPQPDGTYNIDGVTPIREINRALDWTLPDEEATTLAGLIIHEARTIPEVGQRFTFYGFKFEILRRQRNQITAVRVTPPASVTTAAS